MDLNLLSLDTLIAYAYLAWLVAGMSLIVLEVFVPGFFIACLGIGALAASFAAHAGAGIAGQALVFSAVSLGALLTVRPLVHRYFTRGEETLTNADALAGRTGVVTVDIPTAPGGGRVVVGGEDWKAAAGDGQPIPADATVEVVRVEGATLIVRPTA